MALNLGSVVATLGADPAGLEDGLDTGLDKIKDWGGKAKILFAGAAAVGALAFSAGFAAMDIETANDKLAAQLGLTPDIAADVGQVAGDVYADAFGDSMEDVNAAVRSVWSAGLVDETSTNESIKAITEQALGFASAMDQDVSASARAAGQMVKTGLADNAEEAFDILTRGFQVTGDQAEDTLDTFSEYSTKFRDLGIDGAQAMGIISQGLQGGARDGDIVADALKEIAIRAVDGSDATKASFQALGLNADQMREAFAKGGPTAAAALDTVLDKLRGTQGQADASTIAFGLLGTQSEDLGDALYALDPSAATDALGQVDGATDQLNQTMGSNATTNLTSFGRSVQMWVVDVVGGKVLPIITTVAGFLATSFGPALAAIATWITGSGIPALQAIAGWFDRNSTWLGIIAGIITVYLLPALSVWVAAQVKAAAVSTAETAKELAAWVAKKREAIASSATETAAHWKVIGGWIKQGAVAVAEGAKAAGAWIWGKTQAIASATVQAAQHLKTVGGWIAQGATAVAQGAVIVGSWIAQGATAVAQTAIIIASWVAQKAAALLNVGITVASVVAGWIVMAASSIAGAVMMAAAWFIALGPVGWVIAGIVALVALIVIFWDQIKEWTIGIFTAVWEFIKGAFDWVMGIIHGVIDWAKENWPLLLAILTGPFGLAVYFIIKFKDDIINFAKMAVDWVIGKFGDLIDFITSLPGKVASAARGLWDGLVSAFKSAVNTLIRLWNNFSITLGGGSILGVDIPSVTLNTPDIPYLAAGGTAISSGTAMVGENGPELLHLNAGATVEPLANAASRTRIDALERRLDALAGTGGGGNMYVENLHIPTIGSPDPVEDIMRGARWAGAMA